MKQAKRPLAEFAVCAVWAGLFVSTGAAQQAPAQPVRPIGVVKQIQSDQLILHTDAGTDLTVQLPADVVVLRVPPGAKTLQQAVRIPVGEISPSDRVLIIGSFSADQKSMVASRVLDMSRAALAQAHAAQQLDWERRGISGVVQSLDPAAKTLVLAVPNTPPTPENPTHPVTLTLLPDAKLLRYAPDSVKFGDAGPAPFDEIKTGDQVRALGDKSADGASFAAEEVVSGTFENIAATVISTDPAHGTITVKDLATGKPLLVRTDADSKLHRLPPFIAMMIARFNSGGTAGQSGPGGPGAPGGHEAGNAAERSGNPQAEGGQGGGPGMAYGQRGGMGGMHKPPGDFNQMLDRTPPLSLNELKPDEPLIVVSTEGAKPGEVTAIAVMSGVEPILQARPKGSQEVRLGPWNMSVGGAASEGGAGGEPGPQ
jgi:hypothetical protein